jgi:hypothetical protein
MHAALPVVTRNGTGAAKIIDAVRSQHATHDPRSIIAGKLNGPLWTSVEHKPLLIKKHNTLLHWLDSSLIGQVNF